MEPPRLLFELLCSQILLISALLVVEYKEKGVGVELLKYGRVIEDRRRARPIKKGRCLTTIWVGYLRDIGMSSGYQINTIRCRSVAINGNGVETLVTCPA